MNITKFVRILAVATAMLAVNGAAQAELIMMGSTTVQKRVIEPASAAIKSATGVSIKALGTSSGRGFKSLIKGETTVAMASSSLGSLLKKNKLEDDGTYVSHVFSKDVILPIVHKSNPVSSLTFQQLSDIHTGKISNWKDVGGSDMKIIVVTSPPTSATRNVFNKKVMKKQDYVENVRVVTTVRQEIDLVAKLKGGIGALSEGFITMNPDKVKTIKTDTIARPLTVITKGQPSGDAEKVINFLKTPAAREHFK